MTIKLGDFFPKKPFNEPPLNLDDPRWRELEGGYKGCLYDASAALVRLEVAKNLKDVDTIYAELWNELHHQGDVGIASYYALPHLVRIAKETKLVNENVLGLISVIEIQRQKKHNPPLPKLLADIYNNALVDLLALAEIVLKTDLTLDGISSVLTAIALAKGHVKLAEAILNMDSEDVINEFLENF